MNAKTINTIRLTKTHDIMKKIFSFMLALFAAVSLYAADLNIYASGLKAVQQESSVTAYYTLNAPADSLYFMLYGEDINSAMFMTVADPAALSKGAHALPLTLPSDIPAGTYHWAIRAFAPSTAFEDVTDDSGMFDYYLPQDVAVDNNFNSPFFGRVYVCESMRGLSDGHSDACQNQTRGIYMYNADMTFVNGDTAALHGYDGNLGGSVGTGSEGEIASVERHNLKRIAIDEQGYVYIASRDVNIKGVYRMDPANPTNSFVTILNASEPVDALGIVGNELYTLEGVGVGTGTLNKYDLTTIPVSAATASMNQVEILNFGNSDCDAFPDGHGGWWFSEHRYSADAYPCLAHMTGRGVKDYEISASSNSDLLVNSTGQNSGISYRGVVAVNPAGNLLAFGSYRRAVVFSIAYNDTTGVPTLTKVCETPIIGGNIDGVAFDVANNLYVASASAERFRAYSIATTDNSFVTPAPSDSKLYIGVPVPVQHLYLIGDNTGWNPTQGTPLTRVSDQVFEGVFTFTKDTSYFAFFDALAENSDQGGWDYINAHRYAGKEDNLLLNHSAWSDSLRMSNSCFRIPAGQYKLRVDLNKGIVTTFYQAPATISDNAIYISFKDVPGKEDGDNSNAVVSIEDIIKAGADYIDTIPTASKIYNARQGCGIKFGTGSAVGELTLRLANAVIPDAIIVNAIAYGGNNNEGVAVLMGDTVNLKQYGNKVLHPYTKQYDGQTVVSELTFSSTASNRIYLLDVIIIPHSGEVPTGYRIKHPWDVNNIDPWIWQNCEEQADGTWALEDRYYGVGCNIDPKVLDQDWIAEPTLVGNPYNGDSCRFVINPAALEIADILTITKLGEPNPEDTTKVIYDHLYEIGANQGWDPSAGVEMTKKAENVFEGTFAFPANGDSYFGFIADLGADASDWTTANSRRFGPASDGVLAEIGTNEIHAIPGKTFSYKITTGVYVFTVDLNNMTLTVALADGLNNIEGENNVQKVLINGQIYIIRNGERYTVAGAKVE